MKFCFLQGGMDHEVTTPLLNENEHFVFLSHYGTVGPEE